MPSKPPKPQRAPFAQEQTNTYAPYSVAETPEAQAFLNTPLDFGDETNVDPGVGRRTALAEQEANNRYNSAVTFGGVPDFIREMGRAKELRDIRGQGAYEAQQAEYANQQGNNARRTMKTEAELERRRLLLPQILQTGGAASGYGTQFPQSQPSFLRQVGLGLIGGARQAATFGMF